jgi:hypothetical protein
LESDLKEAGLTRDEATALRVSDFEFQYVPKENKPACEKIKEFIKRHEWLGKMPTRPTHRFAATYKGHLAGVIIMATPNSFSNLLGKDLRHLEKLISRGACISWSPKNLGSALIMFSVRWMVKNTEFRFFTAYSDTEARELGTIYQACNFTYLGKTSGAKFEYFDPSEPHREYFSDRIFRKTSFIKRQAIKSGIKWDPAWHCGDKIQWASIPPDAAAQIKMALKNHQSTCLRRKVPPKHKYVYILGITKAETKKLRSTFKDLNQTKQNLKYPKIRGPIEMKDDEKESLNHLARPCRILDQELTKRPNPCWPSNNDENKKFYSIKEISKMYGISLWLLYEHVKSDPAFPVINIGLKKKFVIDTVQFEKWLESKTKKFREAEHRLPSTDDLLEV